MMTILWDNSPKLSSEGHTPFNTQGALRKRQEAFEKCWAHSPLQAAARRLFYIAIHQVSLLSHAATVARRLRIDVHDDNDDNNDNA